MTTELAFEHPECLLRRRHQGVWLVKADHWAQQWALSDSVLMGWKNVSRDHLLDKLDIE